MTNRTVTPDDLARLKAEREQADRRYNEGLTAVDAAIQRAPTLPPRPPEPNQPEVAPLNDCLARLEAGPSLGTGLPGRLRSFVWRLVAPYFERQDAFNATLVDHVNRDPQAQRETHRAVAATVEASAIACRSWSRSNQA